MQDLEEDPELRVGVALFKRGGAAASAVSSVKRSQSTSAAASAMAEDEDEDEDEDDFPGFVGLFIFLSYSLCVISRFCSHAGSSCMRHSHVQCEGR